MDEEDQETGPPEIDGADSEWLQSFIGSSIPEGSLIKGFISIIAWITPEGEQRHRTYTCMDVGLTETVGYLERAKFGFMYESINESEER